MEKAEEDSMRIMKKAGSYPVRLSLFSLQSFHVIPYLLIILPLLSSLTIHPNISVQRIFATPDGSFCPVSAVTATTKTVRLLLFVLPARRTVPPKFSSIAAAS